MIETGPYQNYKFQLGLGADIQEIRQIRHMFLDNIYRDENTLLGYWETRNKPSRKYRPFLAIPWKKDFKIC